MLRRSKQKLPSHSLLPYSICAYAVIFCNASRVPCRCMRDRVITALLDDILWRVTNIVSHYHQKQAQWTIKHVKSQDTGTMFIFSPFTTVAYIKMHEKLNIFRQANLLQFRSSDLSPQSSSKSQRHVGGMHLPSAHANWSGLQVILPGEIVPFVQRIVEIE